MSGLRIQLDTAALERLMGGNSQVELELRQSVVEEFARKHIKELASSPSFSKACSTAADKVRTEINQLVEAELTKLGVKLTRLNNGAYTITLPAAIEDRIRSMINLELDQLITQLVRTEVAKRIADVNFDQLVVKHLEAESVYQAKQAVAKQSATILDDVMKLLRKMREGQ